MSNPLEGAERPEALVKSIQEIEDHWKELKTTVTRTIKLNDGPTQITKTYNIGKPLGKVVLVFIITRK